MAFESSTLNARMEGMEDNKVESPPAPVTNIDQALSGIKTSLFPHQALEIQQIWMTRGTKTFQYALSKGGHIDFESQRHLTFVSGGMSASKFLDQQLVGLVEWSLPAPCQLESYIPMLYTKAKLILQRKTN